VPLWLAAEMQGGAVRTVEYMSAAFLFWILNSEIKGIYSVLRKEKVQWKE